MLGNVVRPYQISNNFSKRATLLSKYNLFLLLQLLNTYLNTYINTRILLNMTTPVGIVLNIQCK